MLHIYIYIYDISNLRVKEISLIFYHIISVKIKLHYQSFFYSPTDAQVSCLKTILKFTLKLKL